jgi:hypothetical protein
VQFDAEVAVIEDGVGGAAAAVVERQGDVVAKEASPGDAPSAALAFDGEQALSRTSRSFIGVYPPDSARRI